MIVPNESHPGWAKTISGEEPHDFEFLATKILVGRLSLNYRRDPSPQTTQKSVAELRAFFEKNKSLSKVQADLRKIIGEGD